MSGMAGLPTFKHGVHPPQHKEATAGRSIERMPFVDEYVLPLSQHIGAPSVPVVEVGAKVHRGQLIAEPRGYISTALHAPVTGTIRAIELRLHPNGKKMPAFVLATDPYDSQRVPEADPIDPAGLSSDEMVQRVQMGGLVGLGGAAFPSHVKFSVPEGKQVRHVVLNGCECEPYLTCDHRIMAEQPEAVIRGAKLIMAQVKAEKGWIGVESNKADAIEALKACAPANIEVVALEVKYPQGAEKMLIDAVFAERVPKGGLPLDLGLLVNNVGTSVALVELFDRGVPLIERVVTVTGPGIVRPRNLIVPLGTPLRAVIEHCGGLTPNIRQVVLGGPMMGMAQKNLDVPIIKGCSGVLCLDDKAAMPVQREFPCIRCGRCLDACPMFLNPARLAQLSRAERPEELEEQQVFSCFECASCSYVCPSAIPLVQWMRMGKAMVRKHKAAAS